MSSSQTYVLISPVKDEEKYLRRTAKAVLRQTKRPSLWVIVNDGSRDGTGEIIESLAVENSWIRVLTLATDPIRKPGSGIIRAFNAGYETVKDQPFDFIVKFDCDIDFSPDYFERLLSKFEQDDKLGIASGIYLEQQRSGLWAPVKMPAYHAAGQTKMVRAQCFRDIGGFVESRGWDTVDEIRAQGKGWTTRHFEEASFLHLKKEGSGIGFPKTNMMHGEIYYLTGGNLPFFALKCIHRIFCGKPPLIGGVLMLWGFLRTWLLGKPKLVTSAEEHLYRQLLNQRITTHLSRAAHVRN